MKQCRYCLKSFPELDFGVAKTTPEKVYRRRKCRYCYRKTKNKLKYKRLSWVANYKRKLGCVRCGIKDHRVLEFHHEDSEKKKFNIADYYYHQYGEDNLRNEIDKCIVICSNCHRILHCEERDSFE